MISRVSTLFGKLRQYGLVSGTTLVLMTLLLWFSEFQIRIFSTGNILKFLKGCSQKKNPTSSCHSPDLVKIVRLLETADRRAAPKPSCLRCAVALAWLSRWFNFAADFKIGVRRGGECFEAHVWLEQDGGALETRPSAIYKPLVEMARP